jgi:NAD(P)-dependent dehydrogenase (short-subunit alcohol dehydrogenase family)
MLIAAQPPIGQVAVVTGGSGGIGRAVAITVAAAGAKVAVITRREGQLVATLGQIIEQRVVEGLAHAPTKSRPRIGLAWMKRRPRPLGTANCSVFG